MVLENLKVRLSFPYPFWEFNLICHTRTSVQELKLIDLLGIEGKALASSSVCMHSCIGPNKLLERNVGILFRMIFGTHGASPRSSLGITEKKIYREIVENSKDIIADNEKNANTLNDRMKQNSNGTVTLIAHLKRKIVWNCLERQDCDDKQPSQRGKQSL